MALLDAQTLEKGREHLRAGDLEAFMAWAREVAVPLDLKLVRRSMEQCLTVGDTQRALRLFEAVWPITDPVADRWVALRRLTVLLVVGALMVFGLLGGVVYFFRAIL